MLYKNTIKMIFSNFNIVWKLLAYLMITFLISAIPTFFFIKPILDVVSSAEGFKSLATLVEEFSSNFNLNQLIVDFFDQIALAYEVIKQNIKILWVYLVILLFIWIIVINFLRGLYNVTVCNILNYGMSSNTKFHFMSSFVQTFKENCKYQLLYLVTYFPLKFIVYIATLLTFKLYGLGGFISVIAPFITVLTYTILYGIINTLFSCWVPLMIVRGYTPVKSLKECFKVVKRRLLKTFSNSFAVVLTILFVNMFVGVFTFGAGLIITIPTSFLLICAFNMLTYYFCNGLKFYIDSTSVVAPIKVGYTEKFKKCKYII